MTAARVAFKYLIMPREPANEGLYRPLKLILPEGKILSARPSAPMAGYPFPLPTVIDAIICALQSAVPALATGAHFGTHSGFMVSGRTEDGRAFLGHDSGHGGWGAGRATMQTACRPVPHHGAWQTQGSFPWSSRKRCCRSASSSLSLAGVISGGALVNSAGA